MVNQYDSTDDTGGERSLLERFRSHPYSGLAVNAGPAAFWLSIFFLVPLAVMFVYSFGERGAFGQVLLGLDQLGLQNYQTFFIPEGMSILQTLWVTVAWFLEWVTPTTFHLTDAEPTAYVQLTIRSIWYGIIATLVCVAVGYPAAYYVAKLAPERHRNLLLALIVLPYWASYLVRIYAVKLLLARNGIVPSLIGALPFVSEPPSLLYNNFSVEFGLIYIWLPFMILPAYASIEQIDFTMQEAAMDLGADRLDAFLRVTFPLSLPGVVAGSILVFIPSVGAYVIPELLGGPNNATIGRFIASQFGAAGNWPLGAAASFVLMAIMMGSIWIYLKRAGGGLA
ncbi:ABC transporter permease [Halolamina sp.]|jgi:spermidine/putrescine transport system permease protein|uniref:ABC transporter permease n=1 Tax=Halolamina sp. TaxID=1940283 RepID=UPI000223BCCE|nr:ABC-type transporter, integral membrane subunit [halophilic archaeon DL31]